MQFIKKQESISLVILGSYNPIYIHAKWMYERGIINKGEWDSHNNDVILPNISRFIIDDVIEFLCDQNRLQIKSLDISHSNRIAKMGNDIINLIKIDNLNALGINADMTFTFQNKDDAYNFGKHFVVLDAWADILKEPRVLGFSIVEQIQPQEGEAIRTIMVQSLGEDNGLPIVNISINNHYNTANKEQIFKFTDKIEKIHSDFRTMYNSLINKM